jgi:CRP-like cAMP-binding protein
MEEAGFEDLQQLFLFQLLTAEELAEVANSFHRKYYEKGQKIFCEGDKGNIMYIIVYGAVKITKEDQGQERELINLAPGDFFGEIALFDYVSRTASATATEETCLLELNRDDFNEFFSKNPVISSKILYQMMAEMARRLQRSNSPNGGLVL